MTDAARITVALADDHELFRKGLRALLATLPGMECAGEAANGAETLRLAVMEQPDVLLLDIRMPGMDGLSALAKIRVAAPEVAVVMLTMIDDDATLADALRAGAAGHLLKDAEPQELEQAVIAAARGDLLFGGPMADGARRILRGGGPGGRPGSGPGGRWAPPLPQLGDRERSVLDLAASGRSVSATALALQLSEKSVRNYLALIPRKLGVDSRDAALLLARTAGLGRGGNRGAAP
ncbi:hypothetical protein ART_3667 [Arthrobacter sp. PAMC 25486]|uniref:response regulator transcription factor n=1 Tax=Arthrobacter sp. PAMC 25486 TaxID=1494608 RepID=UPI0005360E40|nr:response regulator transcription factor [Arthrobacter sp. PAMC 25486]AIY03266.1 hypothetical protein ART_3667 [Arthrobacter sp. PAMC 25486]